MKAYTSPLRRSLHLLAWVGGLIVLFLCIHAVAPAEMRRSAEDATPEPPKATPSQINTDAWNILNREASEKKTDTLVIVVAALGDLGGEPKAQKMLLEAIGSSDQDIRMAAIAAMGQTKNPMFVPTLRKLLDDPKPQIAFAAATTLWSMGDHSGQDLLVAVVEGDRKGNAGVLGGAIHQANKDLHSPTELAKMTAPFVLGPFGIGIAAYNYLHKAGGDSPRVIATELIAQDKTLEVRKELVDALEDKDQEVRLTAARMLGDFQDPDLAENLIPMFLDSKPAVRITAAAAAIRLTSVRTSAPIAPKHKSKTVKR
ncbi:HEAT repeat domain-containing protein [Terriglobus albidus]|uniref:HEAT repeat domain-containing protein n=1 Tax=Terriglobus albidus TaxID=1592106 RepID=UPI0021E09E99|nr:HEAT repeat domain-containing protein [Terriglobus albidus]